MRGPFGEASTAATLASAGTSASATLAELADLAPGANVVAGESVRVRVAPMDAFNNPQDYLVAAPDAF